MIKRFAKGAAVDDLSQVTFPKLASPKLDGFRCLLGEHPLTSRLARFPNEHFHKSLSGILASGHLLDGEVVVGRRRGKGVLQRTSSGLTSRSGTPDFRLWVFDRPGLNLGFEKRLEFAKGIVELVGHPQIRYLKHVWIRNEAELNLYLSYCLEMDYEGIVLRDPDGPYKEGKSTMREQYMLKIKPFDTAEGRIKGWFEEQENTNEAKREITGKLKRSSAKSGKVAKDQLGGFILEDCETGVEVRVGGGFTLNQRKKIWAYIQRKPRALLGTLVRYKKQRVGEKDKPRHPGFVEFSDFRPEWDFTE